MSNTRTSRVQTIAMSTACLIVLLIVGAFLFDAIRGQSLAESLPTLLGYATPAMVTLLTAAKLGGAVDEVKTQVNGNYDKVTTRNRELADQNRELLARVAALTGDPDTGAIPLPTPPRSGGRHRGGPLDGVARFSADTVPGLHTYGGEAHASSTGRVVSGLVLPWDQIGKTTAGPLKIRRKAARVPADLMRCKLHLNHTGTPHHRVVGHAISAEYRDDGLYMSFRVAATEDGDRAMLDVTEHVRDAFSAELAAIRRDGDDVFDSVMTGVALVDTPAFDEARVLEVHASAYHPIPTETPTNTGGNPMNIKALIKSLIADGLTEAEARAKAKLIYGDEADTVQLDDEAPADGAAADGADGAAAEGESAAASYTPRPAVVPQRVRERSAAPAEISLSQAVDAVHAIQTGHAADVAHAALTNITNSSMVDATPPQWLGELWSGRSVPRRIIPLMGHRPLTSWRIQAFKWTQRPAVAAYAGDKNEIPTNAVAIAPYEAEATRWAGGHDLDRKFYDFGDREILDSYWRAMNESYAVVTDANAADWIVANATAAGTAPDLFQAILTGQSAVEDALNVGADYVLANPADKLSLLSITAANAPAYASLFGVNFNAVVWTKRVPAKTVVVGAKAAATHYELPGSPLRVEAEHLSHGGRDAALFGYTALTLDNGAGLVKVTIGTGA